MKITRVNWMNPQLLPQKNNKPYYINQSLYTLGVSRQCERASNLRGKQRALIYVYGFRFVCDYTVGKLSADTLRIRQHNNVSLPIVMYHDIHLSRRRTRNESLSNAVERGLLFYGQGACKLCRVQESGCCFRHCLGLPRRINLIAETARLLRNRVRLQQAL